MNNAIEGSTGMTPDTMMTQSNDYGNDTWSISPYNQSPYNNSPMTEYGNWGGFNPQNLQAEPMASRMPPPQARPRVHREVVQSAPTSIAHHQLPMPNMTWASQLKLTNFFPAGSYSAPPLSMAPVSNPQQVETPRPQPAAPPPPPQKKARKKLSTEEKREMCLYYEKYPSTKHREIGVRFGVGKSAVSRILEKKEHYLKRGQEQEPCNFSDSSAGVKATTPSSDCATEDADGRVLCPYCTNTYKYKKHMRRHLLCHTGDRPYQCSPCGARFMRPDTLKRHSEENCPNRVGNASVLSHLSRPDSRVRNTAQQPPVPSDKEFSQNYGPALSQNETGGTRGGLMENETPTQSFVDFTLFNSTSPRRLCIKEQQPGTEWNGPCIDPNLT